MIGILHHGTPYLACIPLRKSISVAVRGLFLPGIPHECWILIWFMKCNRLRFRLGNSRGNRGGAGRSRSQNSYTGRSSGCSFGRVQLENPAVCANRRFIVKLSAAESAFIDSLLLSAQEAARSRRLTTPVYEDATPQQAKSGRSAAPNPASMRGACPTDCRADKQLQLCL